MRRLKRFGCTVTFLAIGLTGWLAAQAMSGGMAFDISAGAATTTLKEFATQAHLQLLFDYRAVSKLRTPAVKGQLTPTEALKELLTGSGFTFREINDHTIAVMAPGASTFSTGALDQTNSGTEATKEGKTDSSTAFLLAQAASGQAAGTASVDTQQKSAERREGPLQEVIVTAQKKSERLQDVPVPVTAIEATTLLEQNQTRFEDYFSTVPGLSVSPGDEHGAPQLAIRGITTGGFTTPTVGVVIDDVPFGGAGINYGFEAPDLDPSDIAHVEVLRGPQGTLYGDSSMGGLVKYVTIAPSTEGLAGRLQAGLDTVSNGNQLGYNVRGSLNAPLGDTLAVRASGFERLDPGYIDNIVSGQRGVNRGNTYGGRLSLLWEPSSDVTLRLNALYQHLRVDGSPDIIAGPGLGDLQQTDIPGTGWRENEIQAYSANLTAKLGSVTLTSVTGYSIDSESDNYDFKSPFYTSEAQSSFGVTGTPLPETVRTNQFTQELRLTGSFGSRFDWLLGGFYDHVASQLVETVLAADPTTGSLIGDLGSFYQNQPASVYHESAGFLDLTWKVTDQFDVQVGGRESFNHFTPTPLLVTGILGTAFCGQLPCVFPAGSDASSNAFTYLFAPRLRLSPDVMLYARLASGYRPGGSNTPPTPLLTYAPDTTRNYELGLKADALDHTITVDTSLYYIDWRNIQIQLRDPVTNGVYTGNGGRAKSEGAELSVQWRPLKGLAVAGWLDYDDAAITEISADSSAVISEGDRLPNSSRWSGYLSVQQDFPVTDSITGYVAAAESYVGDRYSVFLQCPNPTPTGACPSAPPRQYFPAYAKTDLRAGVTHETWKFNLYVSNLTDRRGILSGGVGSLNPLAFYLIQPRTIGVSVVKSF